VFLSCTKQVSFGSSEPPKVLRVAPFKEFEGSYDTWTQWFGKRRCLRYSNGVTAVSLLTSIKAQSGFGEAPQVRSQFLSLSNNRVCNFPSSLLYLLLSPWWPWGRHATTSVCVHLDTSTREDWVVSSPLKLSATSSKWMSPLSSLVLKHDANLALIVLIVALFATALDLTSFVFPSRMRGM